MGKFLDWLKGRKEPDPIDPEDEEDNYHVIRDGRDALDADRAYERALREESESVRRALHLNHRDTDLKTPEEIRRDLLSVRSFGSTVLHPWIYELTMTTSQYVPMDLTPYLPPRMETHLKQEPEIWGCAWCGSVNLIRENGKLVTNCPHCGGTNWGAR